MSANDDEVDVNSVLAGNISAFEGIVHRWQAPLINLAYRFCGDRGRAEEMAQMAFLRVFRALKTWRKEAAFSTWLFALALNLYRSELRKIPPMALSLDRIAEPRDNSAPDHQTGRDREQAVRRAVFTLPPKYREPLVLFYFQEMDVAAVAATLNLPVGTVKAKLFRAREILRRKLQDIP